MPEKKSYRVLGMTCSTCARNVEKALDKIEKIEFVSVNLATEKVFLISNDVVEFEELRMAVRSAGYDISKDFSEEKQESEFNKSKMNLLLSLVVTIPLSILMILHMLSIHIPYFEYIELFAGIFVVFWTGRKSFKSAWIALIHLHSNMDTLIVSGSVAALATSFLNVMGMNISSFGAIGSMIVTIHLTGKFIETYLKNKASKEIKSLLKIQSKDAVLIKNGNQLTVPVDTLNVRDLIRVLPGERIPIDGYIKKGYTTLDESMITGESLPVEKKEAEEVIGGSLNLTGSIEIEVNKISEDTFLSKMIELIETAQGSKVPIQALADRITLWFVPIIIITAISAAIFWYFNYQGMQDFLIYVHKFLPWIPLNSGPLSFSIFALVSTLVIACPCALGLATPMALITGTGVAAKKGLLIRNAESIQTSKDIDIIIMDKTGTITRGKPVVTFSNIKGENLNICGIIENNSLHPLAKAVVNYVKSNTEENNILLNEIKNIEEISGQGISAFYAGKKYFIGKPRLEGLKNYDNYLSNGSTVVEMCIEDKMEGYFVIEDQLRDDSASAIAKMKSLGYIPVMATGDNEKTARHIASKIGIEVFHAEIKPSEKLEIVNNYQKKGKKVLMTGDGMNDAAALKGADVGMAIGTGTDLAIDNADIIIVSGGLPKILDALDISKKTFRVIRQNLFWAFFYNVIAIPSAFLGILHPAIAETAMAFSSITVVLNSLKIKLKRKEKEKEKMKIYNIPDMSCKHCEMRISKILQEYGIKNFNIILEKKELHLESVMEKEILEKLSEEGYPAKIVK